jgi:hypothetical protein
MFIHHCDVLISSALVFEKFLKERSNSPGFVSVPLSILSNFSVCSKIASPELRTCDMLLLLAAESFAIMLLTSISTELRLFTIYESLSAPVIDRLFSDSSFFP